MKSTACKEKLRTPYTLSLLSFQEYVAKCDSLGRGSINLQFHLGYGDRDTTALHLATEFQFYDVMELLLKHGSDTKAYNNDGQTALHVAVGNGDAKAVDILTGNLSAETKNTKRKKYADVNQKELFSWDTCLCMALRQGDNAIIDILLNNGADVNLTNGFFECPLILACKSNNVEFVEKLISAGANIGVYGCCSGNRQTPMGIISKYNYPDIARILLEHGADVNLADDTGPCPLAIAASYDSTDVINFLLESPMVTNLDFNKTADNGDTILHIVINCKGDERLRLVRKFVMLGVSVNQTNRLKQCPLYDAIHLEDIDMIRLLIELGADLFKRYTLENNFLHLSVILGNLNIVKLLLSRGMDVNQRNLRNETPFFLALNHGNVHIAELLFDCGCNLSLEPYLFSRRYGRSMLPSVLQDNEDMMSYFEQLARVPKNLYDICLQVVRVCLVGDGNSLGAQDTLHICIPATIRDDLLFRHLDFA